MIGDGFEKRSRLSCLSCLNSTIRRPIYFYGLIEIQFKKKNCDVNCAKVQYELLETNSVSKLEIFQAF